MGPSVSPQGQVPPEGQPPPSAAQPPPGYVIQKQSHTGRNVLFACLGCGGLLVILVIVVVAISASNAGKKTNSTSSGGGNGANTASCTPKPCANSNGFTVSVANLVRNAPAGQFLKPEPGNHFVTLQISLKNGSNDRQSANPFDFKLKDSKGVANTLTFSDAPACQTWQAVDLAAGASLGPQTSVSRRVVIQPPH